VRAIIILRILRLSIIIYSIKPRLICNQIDSSTERVYTRKRVYIREERQTYFYKENVKSEGGGGSEYDTTLGLI